MPVSYTHLFLKRDKKRDTSEVFYVRPLSNAEYVIGKIWGNPVSYTHLDVYKRQVSAGLRYECTLIH